MQKGRLNYNFVESWVCVIGEDPEQHTPRRGSKVTTRFFFYGVTCYVTFTAIEIVKNEITYAFA